MSHQVWQKLVESMPGQVHAVIKAKKGTWQIEYIQKLMYIFSKIQLFTQTVQHYQYFVGTDRLTGKLLSIFRLSVSVKMEIFSTTKLYFVYLNSPDCCLFYYSLSQGGEALQ